LVKGDQKAMERTEVDTNVNEEVQEDYVRDHASVIDFKMITFSLAEKDYAIDIMKVKEIAKANSFQLVLDRGTSGIIYANPGIDISDQVLKKMGYS